MRSLTLYATFLILPILLSLQVSAQICKGSLGDPVISEDFGSGTGTGNALAANITSYRFFSDCPNDGYYTIANSTASCFNNTWHTVPNDHTGNLNGYMMIVNASNEPGLFYVQQTPVGALCSNTTYEFSAWILNVIKASSCGGNTIQPNITFSIETKAGVVLKTYNTGNIAATNSPEWHKYGTYFTTGTGVTDVVVKMINNAPGGCGNDLILDDISFRACGPVIQTSFSSTALTTSQDLCAGDTRSYNIFTQIGDGYINPQLRWQQNTGSGWVDINNETAANISLPFINAIAGTYQYRLAVGEGQNINSINCRTFSDALTINVNPLPVITPIPPQYVCEGNTLTLNAAGGATYSWSGPGIPSINQNPLIINNVSAVNAGVYTVVATSSKGCVSVPLDLQVNVLPKVVAKINTLPATICRGGSVALNASGGTSYLWTPSSGLDHDNISNPIASPADNITYTVRVSNDGCFEDSKPITITVLKTPFANAGANKKIFEGQSVQLNGTVAGDGVKFYWTPASGLDDPNSLTPVANPVNDIRYTLNVTSPSCGIDTSSVFIRVYKKITIPNTFSPNNDGINDLWNINALITYPECTVIVYNRYGQEVYRSIGYNSPWRGTINGSALPAGTYYYKIDLKNGTPQLAGWVMLAR